MSIKQTIWSLDDKSELPLASLKNEKELEDLIAGNIALLSSDWLIVGRQVRTSGGIIDLLCVDIGGNPIIIELKKDLTPREVTAQALDYASWVKDKIDADELSQNLAEIYLKYSKDKESLNDAFRARFGIELDDNNDNIEVQIVIVAINMDKSTERIIRFLQGYNININVLFFNVFEHNKDRLLSRAWMFDETVSKTQTAISRKWNGEYYFSYGITENRSWADAVKYGFVSAGGGTWYTNTMQILEPGNRIWVNIPHQGYVGVGTVIEKAKPAKEIKFNLDSKECEFFSLPLNAKYHKDSPSEEAEYIVKVEWQKTVSQTQAISEYGFFGNQNTVCRPKVDKWDFTIERLKKKWGIDY